MLAILGQASDTNGIKDLRVKVGKRLKKAKVRPTGKWKARLRSAKVPRRVRVTVQDNLGGITAKSVKLKPKKK